MEKKKQNKLLLGLCIALIVFTIVIEVRTLLLNLNGFVAVVLAIVVLMDLLVFYYIISGYKKPHGNLLRYQMLMFATTMVLDVSCFANISLYVLLRSMTILLISYIAGRLNKINQNKVLMPIVLLMIFASGCLTVKNLPTDDLINSISYFMDSLVWIVTCAAYFVRYKAHKEAGLTDK